MTQRLALLLESPRTLRLLTFSSLFPSCFSDRNSFCSSHMDKDGQKNGWKIFFHSLEASPLMPCWLSDLWAVMRVFTNGTGRDKASSQSPVIIDVEVPPWPVMVRKSLYYLRVSCVYIGAFEFLFLCPAHTLNPFLKAREITIMSPLGS